MIIKAVGMDGIALGENIFRKGETLSSTVEKTSLMQVQKNKAVFLLTDAEV